MSESQVTGWFAGKHLFHDLLRKDMVRHAFRTLACVDAANNVREVGTIERIFAERKMFDTVISDVGSDAPRSDV